MRFLAVAIALKVGKVLAAARLPIVDACPCIRFIRTPVNIFKA